MMIQTYNPSYSGNGDKRTVILKKKKSLVRPCLKKQNKNKLVMVTYAYNLGKQRWEDLGLMLAEQKYKTLSEK
jgi:hypothetical protein